ncbi:MAG: hypothetical protein M9920_12265 [Verrucomicrobiae bacterium]|nr:hypothetical protein [Verrucomicrobiae bacterium]
MKATDIKSTDETGDLVLKEVWRAKDTLSASYGHDLDKLFVETRKREQNSKHPVAKLPVKRRTNS